jgi:molybdopterin synthase catalytic subunit
VLFKLLQEPIDLPGTRNQVASPEHGAVVTFEGTVRNRARGRRVRFLEYHAYEGMAKKQLEKIGILAKQQYAIADIAIVHRLGHLEPGDCSVVIITAAEHRGPAFDACRFAIDTLKKTVPIWKKEFYEDGEVWIEGGG